ncbi:MAG: LysE family translocator [Pseudohongiellaceae bacterium]
MLDYGLTHWLTFFTASFLLTLSPGPDLAFILAQTARGGRRAGFVAMYGVWTGAFGHVFLAAAGLSAIIATSTLAFTLVKLGGASYLIWLGFQALRAKSSGDKAESEIAAKGSVYWQGVLVALLNPKTAIFFLSFLPQFVVPSAGPATLQLLLHGSLVIATAIFVEPAAIIASATLSEKLKEKSTFGAWLDRILGSVLIGMGLRLILQEGSR